MDNLPWRLSTRQWSDSRVRATFSRPRAASKRCSQLDVLAASSRRCCKMEIAMGMSSGVVILMLVYSPIVIFTGAGSCSTMDTSSVTTRFSVATFSNPARNSAGLITCTQHRSLCLALICWPNLDTRQRGVPMPCTRATWWPVC